MILLFIVKICFKVFYFHLSCTKIYQLSLIDKFNYMFNSGIVVCIKNASKSVTK